MDLFGGPFEPVAPLGGVDPCELWATRVEVHHALQVVGAVGNSVVVPRPDDGHTAAVWKGDLGALASFPTPQGLSVGLRLRDLTLLLIGDDGHVSRSFALGGRTLADGMAWAARAVGAVGRAPGQPLVARDYDLPERDGGQGRPFGEGSSLALGELAAWYANAAGLLDVISAKVDGASQVRCWPHHMDIATLITLDPGADPEKARSVGVGMTPGDGGIAVPYWYVTPWPYPDSPQVPALPAGGRWNTEGWFGAVLAAPERWTGQQAQQQVQHTSAFLESAIEAALALLA